MIRSPADDRVFLLLPAGEHCYNTRASSDFARWDRRLRFLETVATVAPDGTATALAEGTCPPKAFSDLDTGCWYHKYTGTRVSCLSPGAGVKRHGISSLAGGK